MDFRQYIANFSKEKYGRKYIYLKRTEKLIVIMSAHNQGDNFMSLKTFHDGLNYSLLFLNNPENSWYIDESNSYDKIITEVLNDYEPKNVIFYGSSMSGYSSIFFAFKYNANAFAINPQINLDLTKDIGWDELESNLNNIPCSYVALEKYCYRKWKDSAIYILHGHNDLDVKNVDLLSMAKPDNKKLILQTIDSDLHDNYISNDVNKINDIFNIIYSYRDISISDVGVNKKLKERRKEINQNKENNILDNDAGSINWHDRYEHESPNNIVKFDDIGIYDNNGKLSGCICVYNGYQWELISPKLEGLNLIKEQDFVFEKDEFQFKDNDYFYDKWWSRINVSSNIKGIVNNSELKLNIISVDSKNTYISTSPNKSLIKSDLKKQSRYFTFFMDICVSEGEAYLSLGGRSERGYFHSNSKITRSLYWTKISVSELFSNIDVSHKDSIFCRLFYCSDLKNKIVKIKKPLLIEGYFPHNLIV